MNKRMTRCFLAFLLILGVSFSGFAQNTIDNLQESVSALSGKLAESLPFNSSLGLNWSSAHIGKLIPSVPPHFGVGVSAGFTTMDLPAIEKVAGLLGYSPDFPFSKMVLPAYTAEGRIGGFFLPFDIGVKFGYLPPMDLMGTEIDFLLMGADIRYAVVNGKVILPDISIGVGVNYMKAGVSGKVGGSQTFTFGGDSITLSAPEVGLEWKTLSLDFKAQVSKSFLIFTPYLGLGASYAWSEAGYRVKASVTGEINNVKAYLNDNGLADMDVSNSEVSSIVEDTAFSVRAFGGFSVNLAVFRIDLTGLYSFKDSNFGASLGFRFQL